MEDLEGFEETQDAKIDFSKMTKEEQAELAFQFQSEIIEDGVHVMARYLRIGRNLYLVSKQKLFERMGYGSFEEWRAQPEMNMSKATSYGLMKVFDVYIEKLRVSPSKLEGMDWTKLLTVAPFVNAGNVDEYLDRVRSLSRADLQSEMSRLRALAQGKTPKQAEEQQDVLDIVRQACPIQCGMTCKMIKDDEERAVQSFRKFLGTYKGLSAKIRTLFGRNFGIEQKHEPKAGLPSSPDDSPAPKRGEPHLQERAPNLPEGQDVHGSSVDGRREVVEGIDLDCG